MRQEDVDEIWHLVRMEPLEALEVSYAGCHYSVTVFLEGAVVLIMGVSGTLGGEGVPWMLASPLLTKIRKSFLKDSIQFMAAVCNDFEFLHNVAWSKNTEHIRWLKWLGFDFQPGVPMGPDEEIYIHFFKVT